MREFHWIFSRMRNILDKVAEKVKTNILFLITFFRKSHPLWNNVEKYGGLRNDVTTWCIRVECWISKATRKHKHARTNAHALAYASTRPGIHTYALARTRRQICNTYCFSTAKMICERASVLRYTYVICPVLHIQCFILSCWQIVFSM